MSGPHRLELFLSADSEDFCRRLALLESGRPRQNVAAVLAENFSRAERAERLAAYRKKLRALLDNQDKLDGEALRASRRLVRELQDRLIAMSARVAADAEGSISWGSYWLQTLEREAADAVANFARYYAVDLGPWLEKSALNGLAMADAVLDATGLNRFVGLTRETIRTAASWSGDLIVNLSQGALERVNQEVRISLVTGEGVDKLIQRLQGPLSERGTALGSVAYQAERVARTEIAGAQATATQMRQEEVAQVYPELKLQKIWVAHHGPRLCPRCEALDGHVFNVDDPDAPTVPLHPNCLPGWMAVRTVGNLERAFRRPYDGELVDLVVDAGEGMILSVTPNHPVLTTRGWVSAGEVQVGDHLVRGLFPEAFGSPDVDYPEAPIEQVYDAAAKAGRIERVAGSRVQFHGDGGDQQVDVVTADRNLLSGLQAARAKPFEHGALLGSLHREMAFAGAGRSFSGGLPAGSPGHVQSLLLAGVRHPNGLSPSTVPRSDSGFQETPSDNGAAAVRSAGNLQFGNAGLIQADDLGRLVVMLFAGRLPAPLGTTCRTDRNSPGNDGFSDALLANSEVGCDGPIALAGKVTTAYVVSVKRSRGRAHVYNLQTQSGFYTVAGIPFKNCLCIVNSFVPGLSERPKPGERAETVVAGPRGIPTGRQQRASVVR